MTASEPAIASAKLQMPGVQNPSWTSPSDRSASQLGTAAEAALPGGQQMSQRAESAPATLQRMGDIYDPLLANPAGLTAPRVSDEPAAVTAHADSAAAQPGPFQQQRTISRVDSAKLREAIAMEVAEKEASEKEARRLAKRRCAAVHMTCHAFSFISI